MTEVLDKYPVGVQLDLLRREEGYRQIFDWLENPLVKGRVRYWCSQILSGFESHDLVLGSDFGENPIDLFCLNSEQGVRGEVLLTLSESDLGDLPFEVWESSLWWALLYTHWGLCGRGLWNIFGYGVWVDCTPCSRVDNLGGEVSVELRLRFGLPVPLGDETPSWEGFAAVLDYRDVVGRAPHTFNTFLFEVVQTHALLWESANASSFVGCAVVELFKGEDLERCGFDLSWCERALKVAPLAFHFPPPTPYHASDHLCGYSLDALWGEGGVCALVLFSGGALHGDIMTRRVDRECLETLCADLFEEVAEAWVSNSNDATILEGARLPALPLLFEESVSFEAVVAPLVPYISEPRLEVVLRNVAWGLSCNSLYQGCRLTLGGGDTLPRKMQISTELDALQGVNRLREFEEARFDLVRSALFSLHLQKSPLELCEQLGGEVYGQFMQLRDRLFSSLFAVAFARLGEELRFVRSMDADNLDVYLEHFADDMQGGARGVVLLTRSALEQLFSESMARGAWALVESSLVPLLDELVDETWCSSVVLSKELDGAVVFVPGGGISKVCNPSSASTQGETLEAFFAQLSWLRSAVRRCLIEEGWYLARASVLSYVVDFEALLGWMRLDAAALFAASRCCAKDPTVFPSSRFTGRQPTPRESQAVLDCTGYPALIAYLSAFLSLPPFAHPFADEVGSPLFCLSELSRVDLYARTLRVKLLRLVVASRMFSLVSAKAPASSPSVDLFEIPGLDVDAAGEPDLDGDASKVCALLLEDFEGVVLPWVEGGEIRFVYVEEQAIKRLRSGRDLVHLSAVDPPKGVVSPSHYAWHPVCECVELCVNAPGLVFNIVKYLWRAGHKGTHLKDLLKARYYLHLLTMTVGVPLGVGTPYDRSFDEVLEPFDPLTRVVIGSLWSGYLVEQSEASLDLVEQTRAMMRAQAKGALDVLLDQARNAQAFGFLREAQVALERGEALLVQSSPRTRFMSVLGSLLPPQSRLWFGRDVLRLAPVDPLEELRSVVRAATLDTSIKPVFMESPRTMAPHFSAREGGQELRQETQKTHNDKE